MLRLQSLFVSCPSRGSVAFRIEIPLEGWASSWRVSLLLPEGLEVAAEIEDGKVILDQHRGPGVWRYQARILSGEEGSPVAELLLLHVVVLEESAEAVRLAVAKAIDAGLRFQYSSSWTSTWDNEIAECAQGLYRDCRGQEALEICRLLAFEPGSQTRTLRLIGTLCVVSTRPEAQAHVSSIALVAAEVLGTTTAAAIQRAAAGTLEQVKPTRADRWFCVMRSLVGYCLQQHYTDYRERLISLLVDVTDKDYRAASQQTIARLIGDSPSIGRYAARLFSTWGYKEGAGALVHALDMDPSIAEQVCGALRQWGSRDQAAALRDILSRVPLEQGRHIVSLLTDWKDVESVEPILERLASDMSNYYAETVVGDLGKLGDVSLRARIESLCEQAPVQRAQQLRTRLAQWPVA